MLAAIMIIACGPDQNEGFSCARDTRVVSKELCKLLMISTVAMNRMFIVKIWHIYIRPGAATLKCVAHVRLDIVKEIDEAIATYGAGIKKNVNYVICR